MLRKAALILSLSPALVAQQAPAPVDSAATKTPAPPAATPSQLPHTLLKRHAIRIERSSIRRKDYDGLANGISDVAPSDASAPLGWRG
jgi:hypothetical protein